MPRFNVETGELLDPDLYTDVPEGSVPSAESGRASRGPEPARRETFTEQLAEAYGVKESAAPPAVGRLTAASIARMTQEQRDVWLEASREARMDARHPVNDDRHPEHAAALAEFEAVVMGGRDNPVLGELFDGGQLRALDADALSPAPRPALPDGHGWNEAALVLAEIEMHAMNMPPALVMTVTDELATMVEQEVHRGGGWSAEEGRAELARWFGTEGGVRTAANAQWTIAVLAESEHALLRQWVVGAVEDRPNDPYLVKLLGVTLYEAIQNAPPSDALEALLLRAAGRTQQAENAARVAAAKRRQDEEDEADEARADFMDETAARHARWGRIET